jgi:hypothetical protein
MRKAILAGVLALIAVPAGAQALSAEAQNALLSRDFQTFAQDVNAALTALKAAEAKVAWYNACVAKPVCAKWLAHTK